MKKLYYLLFLLLLCVTKPSFAQQSGNEWINYQQTYFKIPVTQKGIYRITYAELQNAGFDLSANPQQIQVFRRGVEQAITVAGEGDGRLDGSDYIEFFGVGNDGSRDAELYVPKESQTNPYVSLFTDNSYYFLTVSQGAKGKRVASSTLAKGGLVAEKYHLEQSVTAYKSTFEVGASFDASNGFQDYQQGISVSEFSAGKGYLDTYIKVTNGRDYSLAVSNPYLEGPAPSLEASFYGVNKGSHQIDLSVGNSSVTTVSFANVQLSNTAKPLEWANLSTTNAAVRVTSKAGSNAVVYFKLNYSQTLDLNQVTIGKSIHSRPNASGTSLFQFSNATGQDQVYDVTDLNNIQRITSTLSGSTLEAVVGNTQQTRNLWVNRSVSNVSRIERVTFRSITPADYNYLILTHKSLQQAANDYATYRASSQGGSYRPLVVDMELISNLFNYGENSPLAIRRFADYMAKSGPAKHLFLIGKAIAPQYFRLILGTSEAMNDVNLVPTGGWPGSDWLLVMGINGKPANVPALSVGRLNTTTSDEVYAYLNKVKEYESQPVALWRKNFLNLSGGREFSYEIPTFRNFAANYSNTVKNAPLGGNPKILSKQTTANVEFFDVSKEVNAGLSMITFFGHSGPGYTDIDIGLATNSNFNNKGKYPIMFVNGCEAGNIFSNDNIQTVGTNWVNTPDRGAIVFLGSSFLGWPSYLDRYSSLLFQNLSSSTYLNKSFGDVLVATTTRYVSDNPNNKMTVGHAQEFNLQGDPAIVPFPLTKPDLAFDAGSLFVESGSTSTGNFKLGVAVSNLGTVSGSPVKVSLKRTASTGSASTTTDLGTLTFNPVRYRDTLYFDVKNTSNAVTNNQINAVIDAENTIDEVTKSNNQLGFDYVIDAPLPVSLIYFRGQVESSTGKNFTGMDVTTIPENVGVLSWKVTDEKNIVGYGVEKSVDGKNWFSIGFTPSQNTSSALYTFYDTKLQVGNSYYRLKIDEASEPDHYSKIIALSLAPTYGLVAYPSPADADVTIRIKENAGRTATAVKAVLYSPMGQAVWKGELQNGTVTIPTQSLTNGLYHLQVNDGTAIQKQKIVVAH
ncbi:putative type IX secretion system sortase PorU2 [Siphonobacter curvatus]|uniref:Gingipain domain-containing protein n=1 Tax=Siphonobacter curvatus TaxID=2094562 RepID=A0A2S7IT68_9BACT|nr:C25 family cysteine peptidase [Siphonobacter curvatus]PQA60913.1 hypothetical protein C5O19_15265 [Siphonobacter curvatus]